MSLHGLNPTPKRVCLPENGGTTRLIGHIAFDAAFSDAAETFCAYADVRLGLSFAYGAGGLSLLRDAELAPEGYRLEVRAEGVNAYASTLKGMHHAMSALLQLLAAYPDALPLATIEDEPDCSYRGLMVDLARQKHPLPYLLRYVDLCYDNRASHLQLHFTDDQSFTLPLDCYPLLCTEGRTYTKEEIARLVEYAYKRGVELVPEVDVPGHTVQFCKKYPELFGTVNVLPADEAVFEALRRIFAELCAMFPHSQMIHIGGDEAAIGNWDGCARTQAYMKAHGIASRDEMYAEYIRIVTDDVLALGRTPVVWEGFAKEFNDRISRDVIVIAWESYYQPAYDLAASGFTLINCSWKPLYIVTPSTHWTPEEIMDWNPWTWRHWWEKSAAYPDGFSIEMESSNVLGGQLCAWGDIIAGWEDYEKGVCEELALIEERLPALCQRTWNLPDVLKKS